MRSTLKSSELLRINYFDFNWRKNVINELIRKVQKLNIADYEKERIGKLTVLFTDVDFQGQELFRLQYKTSELCKLILVSSVILYFDHRVLLAAFLLNVLAIFGAKFHAKLLKKNELEVENARFNSQIRYEEGISGARELVTLGCEAHYEKKIRELCLHHLMLLRNYIKIKNGMNATTTLIKWGGILGAIFISWKLVLRNEMSIGSFYLLYQLVNQFNTLFKQVNDSIGDLGRIDAKFQKLREFFELKEEIDMRKGDWLTGPIESLSFKNAAFSYDEKKVLDNFNNEFLIGKKNALVGTSGSGKTTIANILMKNYQLTSGGCFINDHYNLADINQASWLNRITIVYQDSYFFPDTVRNNLTFGNARITDEKIYFYCEKMMIKDFIDDLPNGLDEYIGERGVNISGGQKQRLALARAFIRNTEILILDEATSALDEILEMTVQKNIEELMTGKTLIVISHRKSFYLNSDKLIYVDGPVSRFSTK